MNGLIKLIKKVLAVTLVLAMALTLMPVVAAAATVGIREGTPHFRIGVDNESSPTVIGFGGKQWVVIGYDGVGNTTPGNTLTLLLANDFSFANVSPINVQGRVQFYSNNQSPTANNYGSSTLKTAMNAAADTITGREEHLILPRTLEGESGNRSTANYNSDHIAGGRVTGARFWPLSVAEAEQVNITVRSFGYFWWLRSPGFRADLAALVNFLGEIFPNGSNVDRYDAVRPAFNLDLSDVLFTSAAVGGKSSAVGTTLSAAEAPTGPLKFTIEDSNLTLFSTVKTVGTVESGDTVSIAYTNANGYFVSCVIVNSSGTVLYYGKLAEITDQGQDGTVSFTVPALVGGNYTIRLFAEEVNGNNLTDFASTPIDITMTVYTPSSTPTPQPQPQPQPTPQPTPTPTPPSSVSDGLSNAIVTGNPIVLAEGASTVITVEDLQTIRDSGAEEVHIVLPNGLMITISDIGPAPASIDLNLELTITGRATEVNDVRIPANSIVIAPAASGAFGFTISFDISAEMLAEAGLRGDNVRLFHISADGVVTEQDRVRRNADGSVTISIDSASKFVLSETVPVLPINFPGVTQPPIPLGAIPFGDVNAGDWFAAYVAWAVANNITTGIAGTNNFAPHDGVTRAHFVTFLHRVMGTPAAASGARTFNDVQAGRWYTGAVAWASSVQIIQVTGDRFRPGDEVTRQEMATFLHRFANHVGANTTASADAFNAFPDRGMAAGWARSAKIWATDNEIITGNHGWLLPQAGANRAEALAIIHRFVDLVT